MIKSKLLTILVSSIILISSINISPVFGKEVKFKDISPSDYYYEEVITLTESEYIKGTSPETFSPKDPITYREFLTLLSRIHELDQGTMEGNYVLSKTYKWLVCENYNSKSILEIPREVAIKSLIKSFCLNPKDYESDLSFHDWSKICNDCKDYFNLAYELGILNGTPEGYLRPENYLSRADAACLIYRVINNDKIKSPGWKNFYLINYSIQEDVDKDIAKSFAYGLGLYKPFVLDSFLNERSVIYFKNRPSAYEEINIIENLAAYYNTSNKNIVIFEGNKYIPKFKQSDFITYAIHEMAHYVWFEICTVEERNFINSTFINTQVSEELSQFMGDYCTTSVLEFFAELFKFRYSFEGSNYKISPELEKCMGIVLKYIY